MATNYGKKFEKQFEKNWNTIKNATCIRLKDVTMGYKKIKNVADFVCTIYPYPYLFLLDCKSTMENTFNFGKLTQWEDMEKYKEREGVLVGAIIWFVNHHKVCFVSIEEFIRLKNLEYKSINVKMINDEKFKVFEIDGNIKRVFIDNDYSKMIEIAQKHKEELLYEKRIKNST